LPCFGLPKPELYVPERFIRSQTYIAFYSFDHIIDPAAKMLSLLAGIFRLKLYYKLNKYGNDRPGTIFQRLGCCLIIFKMKKTLLPYTEEQMQIILTLTSASREEIIKTIKISQVSIKDIINCLQKAKRGAR